MALFPNRFEVGSGPVLNGCCVECTIAGGPIGGFDGIINGAFPATMELNAGGCGGILAPVGNLKGVGPLMGVMLKGVGASDCAGVEGADGENEIGFCENAAGAPNDGGVDSAFAGGVGS